MKIALRIGLLLAVMAGVGLFLGLGPLNGLNQDKRDVSAFNNLVKEFNGLQTSAEYADLNAKGTEVASVSQAYQAGTLTDEAFEKQFVKAGHAFCASFRAYATKEIAVLKKDEWPDSMEAERAALEAYDVKTVEKLKSCERGKSAKSVIKDITDIDATTDENAQLINALNKKASELSKVG